MDIGRGFGFGLFILVVSRWQGLTQIVHNNRVCGAQMEVCSDGCTLQSQSVLNINLQGIMDLLLKPALAEKLGRNYYTCCAQARRALDLIPLAATYISILLFSIWQVSLQLTIMELKYISRSLSDLNKPVSGSYLPGIPRPVQQLARITLGKV